MAYGPSLPTVRLKMQLPFGRSDISNASFDILRAQQEPELPLGYIADVYRRFIFGILTSESGVVRLAHINVEHRDGRIGSDLDCGLSHRDHEYLRRQE